MQRGSILCSSCVCSCLVSLHYPPSPLSSQPASEDIGPRQGLCMYEPEDPPGCSCLFLSVLVCSCLVSLHYPPSPLSSQPASEDIAPRQGLCMWVWGMALAPRVSSTVSTQLQRRRATASDPTNAKKSHGIFAMQLRPACSHWLLSI